MNITLRGPIGLAVLAILAIGGFILALGDVLDFYDAWWKFTVPATLVYAALIWFFATAPAKDAPPQVAAWPLGLDSILFRLLMTAAILLATLGVIALAYDCFGLVKQYWPYIVIAVVLVGGVMLWNMIADRVPKQHRPAAKQPGPEDLVS